MKLFYWMLCCSFTYWISIGCQSKGQPTEPHYSLTTTLKKEDLLTQLTVYGNYEVRSVQQEAVPVKFDDYKDIYTHIFVHPTFAPARSHFEGKIIKDFSFELIEKLPEKDQKLFFQVTRWGFENEQESRILNDIFYLYDFSSTFCNTKCLATTVLCGKFIYFITDFNASEHDDGRLERLHRLLTTILFQSSQLKIDSLLIDPELNKR